MFGVTVPSLGLGIRPRGPRIRPSRPTTGIRSGVAMQRSKLMSPSCTAWARSSAPTRSAPAALASSALSPRANTATRTALPVPCGRSAVPRTIWSAWRGSTPRLSATSMLSSNFAVAPLLTSVIASSSGYARSGLIRARSSRSRLPCFAIALLHHLDAHRLRRALDHADRRVDAVGVEVLHLLLGDLAHLRERDLAGGAAARRRATLLQARGPFQEIAGRRRLGREGEGPVGERGDHHRDRHTRLETLGRGVELLAEFHDVQAALAERRADRRRPLPDSDATASRPASTRVRPASPDRRSRPTP